MDKEQRELIIMVTRLRARLIPLVMGLNSTVQSGEFKKLQHKNTNLAKAARELIRTSDTILNVLSNIQTK